MATLTSRITDLAGAIRDKFNAITPRLVSTGGTEGQVLTKNSDTPNDVSWKKPEDDSFINALIFGG